MIDLPVCTEQAIVAFIGSEQTGLAGSLSEIIRSFAGRILSYSQAEDLVTHLPAYDPEETELKISALCALRQLQVARLRK